MNSNAETSIKIVIGLLVAVIFSMMVISGLRIINPLTLPGPVSITVLLCTGVLVYYIKELTDEVSRVDVSEEESRFH